MMEISHLQANVSVPQLHGEKFQCPLEQVSVGDRGQRSKVPTDEMVAEQT